MGFRQRHDPGVNLSLWCRGYRPRLLPCDPELADHDRFAGWPSVQCAPTPDRPACRPPEDVLPARRGPLPLPPHGKADRRPPVPDPGPGGQAAGRPCPFPDWQEGGRHGLPRYREAAQQRPCALPPPQRRTPRGRTVFEVRQDRTSAGAHAVRALRGEPPPARQGTRNRARAAPVGQRLPCSQLRIVSRGTSTHRASSVWDSPSRRRTRRAYRAMSCMASSSSSRSCAAISASVVASTLAGSIRPSGRVDRSSGSILTRVVLMVRDLLPVRLAGRNDADGRTPHRVDDDIGPPVDRTGQPVAVLAIVPPAILRDDPVRTEEGPDGMGEIEAAALETGTVLSLVPFELHPRTYRPMAYGYQACLPTVGGADLTVMSQAGTALTTASLRSSLIARRAGPESRWLQAIHRRNPCAQSLCACSRSVFHERTGHASGSLPLSSGIVARSQLGAAGSAHERRN